MNINLIPNSGANSEHLLLSYFLFGLFCFSPSPSDKTCTSSLAGTYMGEGVRDWGAHLIT